MRIHSTLLAALLALLVTPTAHARDDYPELAPFTAVRFGKDSVLIEVEGDWYRWKAIDAVKTHELIAFAKKTYRGRWQKRIVEDLVEVLAKMGHKTGKTVKLTLVSMTNIPVVLPAVPMTKENRSRAKDAREDGPREPRRPRGRKDDHFVKRAPFTAARVEQGNLVIEVDGVWYRLQSIDGIRGAALIRFAHENYGGNTEKRLVEDLVEVMTRMGKEPKRTVALELERIDDGKVVSLPRVPMTKENRNQAWRARQIAARGAPVRRVKRRRVLSKSWDAKFAHLAKLVEGARDRVFLSRAQAQEDLDQLEWLVKNVHAYATLRGVDLDKLFDAARAAIRGEKISRNTFAIHVMKVIAMLGDGHARVAENPARVLAPGFLGFLIADAGGRPVALMASRESFLNGDCPYISKLDGVAIQKWIDAAARLVAHGSPQLVRQRSIRLLRHLQHVRRELGLPEKPTVTVELVSEDGKRREELVLPYSDDKPLYGEWPRTKTQILPGGIAYLRVARMDSGGSAPLLFPNPNDRTKSPLADLKGLIVDLRGNGGGTRALLRLTLPLLLEPNAAVVANVAAYRLPPEVEERPDGHLQNRHLFPVGASSVGDADRKVMDAFAQSFQPGWKLPPGFSAWHYMVVRGGDHPAYDGPVILLTDSGCFSATDIFVGAFKGRPNVTVMGTATSGGSGRTQSYTLAHSRLRLRLSSMASFQPNGRLYDTNGIAPDIEVPIKPTDLIGKTDSALDAALERLK